MSSFSFNGDDYLDWALVDIPCFEELQDRLAAETEDLEVERALELGIGTGETARRVLALQTRALLVGIDSSESMLARARADLPAERVQLVLGRLEDPLPPGRFDLVYSALAVHHLEASDKALLFRRIADSLRPGGRLLLADLMLAEDADEPDRSGLDKPDRLSDQLRWLEEVGLEAWPVWSSGNYALISAGKPELVRNG
jgi:tRNA (cmo5U34)-methyltransferase